MEKSETQTPEIRFEPITPGLGFHPFSDGLPYAPVNKTPSRGSGAVAAGPPVFVRPSRPAPQAAPLVTPTPALAPVAPVVMPSRVPAPATQAAPAVYDALGWGYLSKRFIAFAFDLAFQSAVAAGILWVFLKRQPSFQWDLLSSPSVAFVLVLFSAFLNWIILAFQEVAFATSIGKKLLGLELRASAGSRFVRAFFFLPSLGFLGLGVLWMALDRRKRGWHDWIADVQPLPRAGSKGAL